jgi:tetratricopeptide (TPR) repeat protein
LAEDDPAESRIVNPATLSLDLQLDVCQQCHLTGETVYQPGEDATTYRPGRPLSAHRAVFVTQSSLDNPESFGISSHAERMMRSACFEQTQGTDRALTCTTCHDPHTPVAELPVEHFSTTCQSCHDGDAHQATCSRPGTASMAEAMTGNCVSCHMRRAGTSDIPHVSFTDHWIQRTPPPPAPGDFSEGAFRRETPFTLVNLVSPSGDASPTSAAEADIELGMATYMLYQTLHRLPAYLPEVAARIRSGLAAGVDRNDARVTLGQVLLEMDSTSAAERILTDAAKRDPDDGLAAMWLGQARMKAGRPDAALGPLRDAVRLAPRRTEARLKLAEAEAGAGQLPAAIVTLEAALAQDPVAFASAWNDLGFYSLQLGKAEAALAPLRRSVALDPQLELARVNLGAALLASDDLPAAAAQLTAALRINPDSQGALGNLGVVRGRQGKTAEARSLFQRLLALNPGDARAAAALAELDS